MLIFILMLTDDEQAVVEVIYNTHSKKMFSIAMKILKSENDSEVAVQESFVKIMNRLEKMEDVSSVRAMNFCFVTVKNTSLNMLKRKKMIDKIEFLEENIDEMFGMEINETEPLSYETENKLILSEMIADLSKELISLRFKDGLRFKAIGEIFNISEDAAQKRYKNIMKKLRDMSNKREVHL